MGWEGVGTQEKSLVGPGLQTTLESVLFKEVSINLSKQTLGSRVKNIIMCHKIIPSEKQVATASGDEPSAEAISH